MRLTEFERLLTDEFGAERGRFIASSHILSGQQATADELLERGVDPAQIWEKICIDFDIPEERRLGKPL
ncbi:DUF3046 domain-containing protein [Corynebacterium caspium]|uniref:DUF3046 domain-containing protein n=1 Tax=Corynebacterium caspium TaxID=234828 RepID=UPI00035F2DFE|nr:DUF3046 domain-containing protein [Corynebacterium caspium]WKD59112.1 hypothetical protein CCASP_03540 [Corynebacterium caspium DSM 44850]